MKGWGDMTIGMTFKEMVHAAIERCGSFAELGRRADLPARRIKFLADEATTGTPDQVLRIASECRKILKEPWQSFGSRRIDETTKKED